MEQRAVDAFQFLIMLLPMKADDRRLTSYMLKVILLAGTFLAMCGCATKSNLASKPVRSPGPYATSAGEFMQRGAVKARTRELIKSGKYKDSADARRAAQKEYPPVVNSDQGTQEAEYHRWKQQVKVQEKFEADLDKMKRKS